MLAQNLYYNYYYPKPKYLIIGYKDPLGQCSAVIQDISQEYVISVSVEQHLSFDGGHIGRLLLS